MDLQKEIKFRAFEFIGYLVIAYISGMIMQWMGILIVGVFGLIYYYRQKSGEKIGCNRSDKIIH